MRIRFFTLSAIIVGLFVINNQGYSQGKYELSEGLGYPELINMKISYGNNLKIALSQSILPIMFRPLAPVGPTSVEVYYHFAGKSKYTVQSTWYCMSGIGLFWPNEGGFTDIHGIALSAYPRVGRTINFSKRGGINIDGGIFIPFYYIRKGFAHPSLNINFFTRLGQKNK